MRVLIADDHALFRAALRRLLGRLDGIDVVAECTDTATAVAGYAALRPDVAILDLHMPDEDGLAATRRILALDPAAKVLLLSLDSDEALHSDARAVGALGYLAKQHLGVALEGALATVSSGRPYPNPEGDA